MSGGIFVSYRRLDASGSAGRLYDRVTTTIDKKQVFFDIDDIDYGVDFVDELSARLEQCDVLIAVIGRRWTSITNEQGQRRLDLPGDTVRIEIESALDKHLRVIPVLVDGARMPAAEDLPETIRTLARRNALEVSHERFNFDVDRLVEVLRRTLDERARRDGRPVSVGPAPTQPAQDPSKAQAEAAAEEWRKRAEADARRIEDARRSREEFEAALRAKAAVLGTVLSDVGRSATNQLRDRGASLASGVAEDLRRAKAKAELVRTENLRLREEAKAAKAAKDAERRVKDEAARAEALRRQKDLAAQQAALVAEKLAEAEAARNAVLQRKAAAEAERQAARDAVIRQKQEAKAREEAKVAEKLAEAEAARNAVLQRKAAAEAERQAARDAVIRQKQEAKAREEAKVAEKRAQAEAARAAALQREQTAQAEREAARRRKAEAAAASVLARRQKAEERARRRRAAMRRFFAFFFGRRQAKPELLPAGAAHRDGGDPHPFVADAALREAPVGRPIVAGETVLDSPTQPGSVPPDRDVGATSTGAVAETTAEVVDTSEKDAAVPVEPLERPSVAPVEVPRGGMSKWWLAGFATLGVIAVVYAIQSRRPSTSPPSPPSPYQSAAPQRLFPDGDYPAVLGWDPKPRCPRRMSVAAAHVENGDITFSAGGHAFSGTIDQTTGDVDIKNKSETITISGKASAGTMDGDPCTGGYFCLAKSGDLSIDCSE